MSSLSHLDDASLAIIFATSPTGLGHLRVTDSLYHGLPPTTSAVLLGAQSSVISAAYRFISIHPFTRNTMELLQAPPWEDIATSLNRTFVRSRTKLLYQQLKTVLNERFIVPKTVLLVAPHSLLGQQLGAIKQKLSKELGIRIILVVQVTDDSPQTIWYVPEADTIFVPSQYTKQHLLAYAKKANLPMVPIEVTAYPLSPLLTEVLPTSMFSQRSEQLEDASHLQIHMTVPVSGAAVGTSFMQQYIKNLHHQCHRFVFHVVTREAPFTQSFIKAMSRLPYVTIHSSNHDRMTVDMYEKVFQGKVISLEITKPSEQAFKALIDPTQRGGVVLLFSQPVGRQEYDNLHFLRNHGLMPHSQENQALWDLARQQQSLQGNPLLEKARYWRAILLPNNPKEASLFTDWCLQQKLFLTMIRYKKARATAELQSNGVEQFWQHVAQLLRKEK